MNLSDRFPGKPAGHTALESFNFVIKECGTFRKRFPIGQFLSVASEMVAGWSAEYMTSKAFVSTPSISLSLWTKSYQWVIANPKMEIVLNQHVGNLQFFCIPSKSLEKAPSFASDWTTFDAYKEQHFSTYEVCINEDGTLWKDGECTCPAFLKDFICKHVVGVAIRCKYVVEPPPARNIPIGQKRKRGRPQLAKNAWIVQ